MLEIAGGILIAAAVLVFLWALFKNPGGVWEALKIAGALGCAAALAIFVVFQLAH